MRLLMLLSSASLTGPAELCLDDGRALREAGHEVLFGCDTRRPGNYAAAIREAGFTLMDELTLCPSPKAVEIPRDVLRLRSRMKGADLVHCRFAHDHTLALLARSRLAPAPALVRTAEIARSMSPGVGRGIAFRACEAVVVANEEYATRMEKAHELPAERLFVVPGRVDSERFSPGDGTLLRSELSVGSREVLFGIVSRIKADRRHELLVRAFAPVARRHPEANLAIVGRGEYEPELRDLVGRLGLGEQVHFAGYQAGEALVAAYRALDVACWLSEGNDGTCRGLLEAMACEKPVVAVREGTMAAVVRDGRDGLLVEPEAGPLEKALEALCDGRLRQGMGACAREHAETFTQHRRTTALLSAYRAATARPA